MPPRLAAPADELPTVRKKKREYVSDSDEDVNIFDNPKFRRHIKTTSTPDSDDDKPLFPERPDSELFSQAPQPSPPPQPPTQPPQPNWQPNFINNPSVTNARVKRQLEKVVNGGDSIKFQSPGPGANLEGQVELLIQAAEHFPQVKSIELQAISTLFHLIVWILNSFCFRAGCTHRRHARCLSSCPRLRNVHEKQWAKSKVSGPECDESQRLSRPVASKHDWHP
jgi:hypothetical protein